MSVSEESVSGLLLSLGKDPDLLEESGSLGTKARGEDFSGVEEDVKG